MKIKLPTLNLPEYDFKIRQSGSKYEIFDRFRNKYVNLEPEEWVRQNFLEYMIQELNYPISRIAVEREIKVGNRKKRFDALVFDKNLNPFAILETKAPDIKIDQKTFDQVGTYNSVLGVTFIFVSNGNQHFCLKWQEESKKWAFLDSMPKYI